MVSVTWAWTDLLPFSFPDFSASCTAFSIARYEVTPRCFKNLRISIEQIFVHWYLVGSKNRNDGRTVGAIAPAQVYRTRLVT